jgi:siroheme synthase
MRHGGGKGEGVSGRGRAQATSDSADQEAERLLAQAEAVIYDKLVSAEILALANPKALFVHARKQQGLQEEVQAEVFAWYLRLRSATGAIVRLKSGDPMVFGRGAEELEFLTQHGFDVEVVPGVSSVTAAPRWRGSADVSRRVVSAVLAGIGRL